MKLTGQLYKEMTVSANHLLTNKKVEANNMNVFPVPDGDTGINMSLTMSTLKNVENGLALGDCAAKVADQMLRSARGNSGAILSLFFRGISKAFAGLEEADAEGLVAAFERGTKEAYRAVMKPMEGTILTVMRVATENARSAITEKPELSIKEAFSVILAGAEKTLAETPEMLPVLKEAGVVDAGGFGFVCCLGGMMAALEGHPVELEAGAEEGPAAANFADFETEDINFAYCTECIVEKSDEFLGEDTAGELCAFIKSIGDSAVFIDDEKLIKLHVHTNDPGAVLSHAIVFGSLLSVKIENMRNQHTALASGAEEEAPAAVSSEAEAVPVEKKYGFVSVCMGDGIREAFLNVGVDQLITGGQTMNPSTQNIIDAVLKTPAECVFILPNNKNICMVAKQAAELVKERRVIVIPTETVPQGISAMLAFDPEADCEPEAIVNSMKEAYYGVTTMSVTYAVRDTSVGRFRIEKGQYLGLVENTIACVAKTNRDCMEQLIRGMADASVITVFCGENISEDEAAYIEGRICERIGKLCDVTVIPGGQPIYDYIVSVEQ